jgi:D-glutamate cyclase
MTTDEKLAAILAAVQIDPGNRGLAKLFGIFPHDFANACHSLANHPEPGVLVHTGFFIPSGSPPAFETDGPLGAAFLMRTLHHLGIGYLLHSENDVRNAIAAGLAIANVPPFRRPTAGITHVVAIERAGPAADGTCYTMRGRDLTPHLASHLDPPATGVASIGIGDGGNEIGMGKLPHELIAENIPNGDLIHCRVATDHLIVAGVSNWGAYALAAGLCVLRDRKPPPDLFDPDRERVILEAMVKAGPLVDGVTGQPAATVDGLTWDGYAKPLRMIDAIVKR